MQFILTLACVRLKMTPAEAITAATVNAAYALERHDRIGILKEGFQADLMVLDVPNYRYIPYHFATNHVRAVVKKGKVVVEGGAIL
jgi:imidazolonepropionase